MKKALVTGGAGFIGSNLTRRLIADGYTVDVLDNFSTGKQAWVPPQAGWYHWDLRYTPPKELASKLSPDTVVFHLQGLADVRNGPDNLGADLSQNVYSTHNLLEACRLAKVKKFVFSSSAVVYGEPDVIPTPESYAGIQTSIYGAHKLAAEAEIQAYAHYFGMQWLIFRFVSFLGAYYHHGVIWDFVKSLRKDPTKLAILGDGQQTKSYLHVQDGISGIFLALESGKSGIFNLGHDESMKVDTIADLVIGLFAEKAAKVYVGGKRGWVGDSPVVRLDTSKIKKLGWEPIMGIQEAVLKTAAGIYALNPWKINET